MTAQQIDFDANQKGVPLFMRKHTVVDNHSTIPHEGVDFTYNIATQKAEWLNPDATNKWSPTAHSDTKIDGVDFVAINYERTE